MSAALIDMIQTAPRLSSPEFARRRLAGLMARAEAAPLAEHMARAPLRDLALGLADHSPYLWGLIAEDPSRLARLLGAPPRRSLDRLLATMAERRDEDEARLAGALRFAKREAALLVALADIGGLWDFVEVTDALSRFADGAVACALRFVLRQNAAAGRLAIDADAPAPEQGCGLVVLGLGKHGARELNYSSDVDLIVLFDPQSATIPPGVAPGPLFVRIAKALARLLQERTSEGYVLRVDLRLRPDPGATPIALAIPSAYAYYETLGQNWERAAMIKARPGAGDAANGERLLETRAPFNWRKYFEYAAIAHIKAKNRQIHAVRGQEQ
ncbi:MAG: bifunctional [glutamine synthetase] adenylyltransferase/[glutamine synthetase]-adenylyl-L-tyrosine phosphorylase, partial [Roseiarcus sp.]